MSPRSLVRFPINVLARPLSNRESRLEDHNPAQSHQVSPIFVLSRSFLCAIRTLLPTLPSPTTPHHYLAQCLASFRWCAAPRPTRPDTSGTQFTKLAYVIPCLISILLTCNHCPPLLSYQVNQAVARSPPARMGRISGFVSTSPGPGTAPQLVHNSSSAGPTTPSYHVCKSAG